MTNNPYEREYRELEDLGIAPPIPAEPEKQRLIATDSEALLYKHQRALRREGYDPQLKKPLAEDTIIDQEEADRDFMRSLDNVPKPKPKSKQAQEWLAAQAATENAAFFSELHHYRAARMHSENAASIQSADGLRRRITSHSVADAGAANADFQQHLSNYDPSISRRMNVGSKAGQHWDRGDGVTSSAWSDAAMANHEFFRDMRHWRPG